MFLPRPVVLSLRRQSGITLVELVISLSVIAILLSTALFLANKVVESSRVHRSLVDLGSLIVAVNDGWVPSASGQRDFSQEMKVPSSAPKGCASVASSPISAGLLVCLGLAPASMVGFDSAGGPPIFRNAWGSDVVIRLGKKSSQYVIEFMGVPYPSCDKLFKALSVLPLAPSSVTKCDAEVRITGVSLTVEYD